MGLDGTELLLDRARASVWAWQPVAEVVEGRQRRRNRQAKPPAPPPRINGLRRRWGRHSACRDFYHGLLEAACAALGGKDEAGERTAEENEGARLRIGGK